MAEDSEKKYGDRAWLYVVTVALVLLPLPILILSAMSAMTDSSTPLIRLSIIILLVAYYATSFRVVQEDHIGGVFVLQQYAWEVGPFIYFVPRYLMELHVLPVYDLQKQFPGNPEEISKRHDEIDLNGLLRPFRIPTAGNPPNEGDDPLTRRMTLEPTASVVWRLARGSFFRMWIRIPGKTWREKERNVLQQMYDSLHSGLGKSFSKRTPAQIYMESTEIDQELETLLEERLAKFGVDIDRVEVQPPDLPYDVNKAMARSAAAVAEKQATIITAQGTKEAEILIQTGVAEGRERLAEARKRELAAEGEGLKAAADAMGISPEDYRAGEIAKATVGEGTLILGAEGIAQAVGLGKLILNDKKGADA